MVNKQSYQGIERSTHPDWLGWTIIDMLEEKKEESEEHIAEIKRQLDYEVRFFKANNYNINLRLIPDSNAYRHDRV